jgi:7-cyano-7-deazaguanine synthase in queuosine biosynthesis
MFSRLEHRRLEVCVLDFTYTFDHIGERLKKGQLRLTDHATNQTRKVRVAVDDYKLPFKHNQATPPLLADLTDLAAAVHIADRLSRNQKDMPRRILIRLPIRQSDILDQPFIHQKLLKLLYWFTEDEWSFEFLPYTKGGRSSELKSCLPFPQGTTYPTHIVLWSGGLDAFAGLYQQLKNEQQICYTLFGTGGNNMIAHAQRRTASAIEKLFPKRTKLIQLPLQLSESSKIKKSSSARSRGFVFMLLGAVCACQEGQTTLNIYENGVGAINLPFRASEVGLDHSRSVHPLSLYYMGELLSSILGRPFSFQNPFLFQTKAQMCREPLFTAGEVVFTSTISCDSRHRKRPIQCGYCSSCLLRRQAIAAQGIADVTPYQITDALQGKQKRSYDTHYYAMLAQVQALRELLAAADPWERMSQQYSSLEGIVEKLSEQEFDVKDQILHLYQNYVHEWDCVRDIIGPEFLE